MAMFLNARYECIYPRFNYLHTLTMCVPYPFIVLPVLLRFVLLFRNDVNKSSVLKKRCVPSTCGYVPSAFMRSRFPRRQLK